MQGEGDDAVSRSAWGLPWVQVLTVPFDQRPLRLGGILHAAIADMQGGHLRDETARDGVEDARAERGRHEVISLEPHEAGDGALEHRIGVGVDEQGGVGPGLPREALRLHVRRVA